MPSNLEKFCNLLNGTDANPTKILGTLSKFENKVNSISIKRRCLQIARAQRRSELLTDSTSAGEISEQ